MSEKTVAEALEDVRRSGGVGWPRACAWSAYVLDALDALAREKADKAVCAACAREPHQMHAPLEHQRDRRETVAYWEASFKEMRDGYDKVSAERAAAKAALAQMAAERDDWRSEAKRVDRNREAEADRVVALKGERDAAKTTVRRFGAWIDSAVAILESHVESAVTLEHVKETIGRLAHNGRVVLANPVGSLSTPPPDADEDLRSRADTLERERNSALLERDEARNDHAEAESETLIERAKREEVESELIVARDNLRRWGDAAKALNEMFPEHPNHEANHCVACLVRDAVERAERPPDFAF